MRRTHIDNPVVPSQKNRILARGSTIIAVENNLRDEHLEACRELGFSGRMTDGTGYDCE